MGQHTVGEIASSPLDEPVRTGISMATAGYGETGAPAINRPVTCCGQPPGRVPGAIYTNSGVCVPGAADLITSEKTRVTGIVTTPTTTATDYAAAVGLKAKTPAHPPKTPWEFHRGGTIKIGVLNDPPAVGMYGKSEENVVTPTPGHLTAGGSISSCMVCRGPPPFLFPIYIVWNMGFNAAGRPQLIPHPLSP